MARSNRSSTLDPNTPSPAALRRAMDLDSDTTIDIDPSRTRAEAAAFLGISVAFLKKLDLAGRGPVAVRIGRRWTYLQSDLLAFRHACRQVPVPKLEPVVEPAANDAEMVVEVKEAA